MINGSNSVSRVSIAVSQPSILEAKDSVLRKYVSDAETSKLEGEGVTEEAGMDLINLKTNVQSDKEINQKPENVKPGEVGSLEFIKAHYSGALGIGHVEYDEQGRVISFSAFDSEYAIGGENCTRYIVSYNDDGTCTVTSLCGVETRHTSTSDTYDKEGKLTNRNVYDKEGNLKQRKEYVYMPNGKFLMAVVYDGEGNVINVITGYQ